MAKDVLAQTIHRLIIIACTLNRTQFFDCFSRAKILFPNVKVHVRNDRERMLKKYFLNFMISARAPEAGTQKRVAKPHRIACDIMRVEPRGPYDDAPGLVANREATQVIFRSPLKEG